MSTINRKGPLLESCSCRCCGVTKRCRILNAEYEWQGRKEVYSDMFVDCFGLLLSNLDGEQNERAICATCVSRLREASAFHKQVLQCEERLLNNIIHVHNEDKQLLVKPEIDMKIEMEDSLKVTPEASDELLHHDLPDDTMDMDGDTHIDSDDLPLIKAEAPEKTKVKVKKKKVKLSKMKKTLKNEITKNKSMQKEIEVDSYQHLNAETIQQNQLPDHDKQIFHNIATIVENSYVCPFHTSFSDYYCIYCKATFTTDPNKLREHTLTHDQNTYKNIYDGKKPAQIDVTRIDCRLCSSKITDIDCLKDHLVNMHGKTFYPLKNEFLKFKLTSDEIVCTECGTNFKFFHALKKHMAEHFGTCICDICGAHYFEERILLIHMKTHQRTENDVFLCKECGKSFKSRHNRYLHEARVHKKEAAYPCSKCDDILFTYSLRYRHMIEVHGIERVFKCDDCDRVYDSRKSLREHTRRAHLKIMKHQCDLCDKRFYLPSRLKEHMYTHTGERNYRCDYCGKSFPRLRGLKVHIQSHSTEKKFRCVLCTAAFTQNVNLKNHMKRHHQDDRYSVMN